jgi:hypothetical protein
LPFPSDGAQQPTLLWRSSIALIDSPDLPRQLPVRPSRAEPHSSHAFLFVLPGNGLRVLHLSIPTSGMMLAASPATPDSPMPLRLPAIPVLARNAGCARFLPPCTPAIISRGCLRVVASLDRCLPRVLAVKGCSMPAQGRAPGEAANEAGGWSFLGQTGHVHPYLPSTIGALAHCSHFHSYSSPFPSTPAQPQESPAARSRLTGRKQQCPEASLEWSLGICPRTVDA